MTQQLRTRRLSFGSPLQSDPETRFRWIEQALRQIERASFESNIPYDARDTVTEITVNGSTLPDWGLAVIRTTGGTAHRLPSPRLGVTLIITCLNASTNDITVTASTSVTIDGSTGANQLLFEEPDTVVLKGISSTEWIIAQSNGSVSIASTS